MFVLTKVEDAKKSPFELTVSLPCQNYQLEWNYYDYSVEWEKSQSFESTCHLVTDFMQ